MPLSGSIPTPTHQWIHSIPVWLLHALDLGLVVLMVYMILLVIGEKRNVWMLQGLGVLIIASVLSNAIGLVLFAFVLEKLVLGSAVAMSLIFQAEIRRFLEHLGRGKISQLLTTQARSAPQSDPVIDEIVDAVKELSQNRTGALMVLETEPSVDERDFSVPGVVLNAQISKELIQTIFQTSTLLHDGAVFIRGSRLVSAGVILPLSDRTASRQLGTRHRAAMGITERVDNCLCIVVSEETGSISLAEGGSLNRPLTSTKLKELLESRFAPAIERDTVATLSLGNISRKISVVSKIMRDHLLPHSSSNSHKKK